GPGYDMVALLSSGSCLQAFIVACRPDKEINHMFAMLIDQDCYCSIIHIVEASTGQGIALLFQVYYWRRKVQLAVKPGFDCMLIGRGDIHQVAGHQRTNVAGEYFLG